MLVCALFLLTCAVLRTSCEVSLATYLQNVDLIIARLLENPIQEDAEDLKDNVDDYINLLSDLLKSVRKGDVIGVKSAKEYIEKGTPKCFQEDKNGDIFTKLTDQFKWSQKDAKTVTGLIDKAKSVWSQIEKWNRQQAKVPPDC